MRSSMAGRERLRLGEPDRADLRRGEDGGRDEAVIDRPGLAAEGRVGEGVALADRDRRQVRRGW